MRTRRLGPFTVTAVGSGNVCLPISAARGVRASDVEHALHETIAFGVTLIDVAADADSEKLVGEVVRDQRARDRMVVATRVPLVPLVDERPGPPRDLLRERLPMPYLQYRVEAALRATRLDALPLVQLSLRPAWLASPAWPELVDSCARLVQEGKVLAWGAWIDDVGDLGDLRQLGSLADLRNRSAGQPAEPRVPGEPVDPAARTAHRAPLAAIDPAARTARLEPATPGGRIVLADLTALDPYAEFERTATRTHAAPAAAGPGVDDATADRTPDAAALLAEPWLAAVSVVYQLCDRRAEPLLAAAAACELAVLARHPLAGGALAGTLAPGVLLSPRDDRNALAAAELERIAVGISGLAGLVKRAPPAAGSCAAAREVAERAQRTRPDHLHAGDVAELALRVVIDRSGIALPRLHRRDHLLPAIGAAAAPPLPADLVAEIDRNFEPEPR